MLGKDKINISYYTTNIFDPKIYKYDDFQIQICSSPASNRKFQ